MRRTRLTLLTAALLVWAVVVVARLAYVQIFRHDDYVTRAGKQQERTLELTPLRGSIFDARGRILAESIATQSIYADPQAIGDWKKAAALLASVPGMETDRKELEKRLRARGEFAWVARQVTPSVARAVRELKIDGVYFLEEHRRSYPKNTLAANALGYVGLDGEGLAGVEYAYDTHVSGKPGKVTLLRDARRGMYLVGGEGANAPADGNHVVLTIDEVIQFISERALQRAVKKWGAPRGSVIVMDPNDGSILAIASWPTFDPNHYRDYSADHWRNRPVQDLYEPGSTFKIVTAAAGLEEKLVTPSQIVDCGPGYIELAGTRIREHDGKVFGYMSFQDVLTHSSNVGTIRVGLALGQERLYRYMRDFGFGERTGLNLPGEAPGMLRPPRKWSKLSNAVLSIGQEIGTTPIQILRATSAIANGGVLVEPRIVDRVVDSSGRTIDHPKVAAPRRVISEKTAAILNEMLKTVVAQGTGRPAALADHVVAGKTGTAQKAGRGGYLPNKTVASFVGYVPADRPRLAILVVVDEPRSGEYGGTVAAPVFREIAEGALRYLRVEPSLPSKRVVLAANDALPSVRGPAHATSLIGLDTRSAVARATAAGLKVKSRGTGVVVTEERKAPGEVEIHSAPLAEKSK
jgi:cell division protein FtsI (penicillin-binding protein 3)